MTYGHKCISKVYLRYGEKKNLFNAYVESQCCVAVALGDLDFRMYWRFWLAAWLPGWHCWLVDWLTSSFGWLYIWRIFVIVYHFTLMLNCFILIEAYYLNNNYCDGGGGDGSRSRSTKSSSALSLLLSVGVWFSALFNLSSTGHS